MRISRVFAFAAATVSLGVSTFACAAPSGSVAPASRAAGTVLVNAAPRAAVKLTPAEVQDMAGTFSLDDGRMLVLTSRRNRLFAELDGRREELAPLGDNQFVGRDSGARLTFDQVPFGTKVVLDQAK